MPRTKQVTGTRGGLAYLGVEAPTPANFTLVNRPPTTRDNKEHNLGDLWLDTSTNNPPIISDLYILVSLANNIATWLPFGSGALAQLEGNTGGPVSPDPSDTIFVLGDTVVGVTVAGNPGTNTLTVTSVNGEAFLESLTGDSGGPVFADVNHNINVVGSGLVSVAGNPGTNTLTISAADMATQYDEDSGSAIPALNVLNVLGDSSRITTSGAGNTITISTMGGATESSFLVTVSAPVANFTGDDNFPTVPFDTAIFNVGSDFNTGTFTYTAPLDGSYFFHLITLVDDLSPWAGDHSETQIVTSNRTYSGSFLNPVPVLDPSSGMSQETFEQSQLADMDAADTCYTVLNLGNDTRTITLVPIGGAGDYRTVFDGHMVF
jgi:hypothetical protein